MADPSTLRLTGEELSARAIAGRVLAGKYRVDGVLGAGGMGLVLAAEHLQLGQKVAIKLISMNGLDEGQQSDARRRFLREGQAAAKLTSDHVVRIFDVGTLEDGAPFMVMEMLRGKDLAQTIEEMGPAPVEVAVDFVIQACDALGEAHGHGIVHRDLKPANLFVCRRSDGQASIKVLDFGISKVVVPEAERLDVSLTSTRSVVGSPHYMSPEQLRNAKTVDARSDVWALGTVLYELLVGRPVFDADTLPGICAAIAADAPAPLTSHRADVPAALEQVVLRCLEKRPESRFQSVAELVAALQPFAPAAGSRVSAVYASLGVERASSPSPAGPASAATAELANTVAAPSMAPSPAARPVPLESGTRRIERRRTSTAIVLAVVVLTALAAWVALRPQPASKAASPPQPPTQSSAVPREATPVVAAAAAEPPPANADPAREAQNAAPAAAAAPAASTATAQPSPAARKTSRKKASEPAQPTQTPTPPPATTDSDIRLER